MHILAHGSFHTISVRISIRLFLKRYIDITCLVIEDRKVLLKARDPISDIAIFETTDPVGIDDPFGSITLGHLHAHDPKKSPVQVWTVAYCGESEPARFANLRTEYMQASSNTVIDIRQPVYELSRFG